MTTGLARVLARRFRRQPSSSRRPDGTRPAAASARRLVRSRGLEQVVVDASAEGFHHRPDTTFGTVDADVLEHRVPGYRHLDVVEVVEGNSWPE